MDLSLRDSCQGLSLYESMTCNRCVVSPAVLFPTIATGVLRLRDWGDRAASMRIEKSLREFLRIFDSSLKSAHGHWPAV